MPNYYLVNKQERDISKNNNIFSLLEETFNDQHKSQTISPSDFDCVDFLMTAEIRQILEDVTG